MKVHGELTIDDESNTIVFDAEGHDELDDRGFRTWDWTATSSTKDGDAWFEGELIHNNAHSIASLGSKILMAVHMAMLMDEAEARTKANNND